MKRQPDSDSDSTSTFRCLDPSPKRGKPVKTHESDKLTPRQGNDFLQSLAELSVVEGVIIPAAAELSSEDGDIYLSKLQSETLKVPANEIKFVWSICKALSRRGKLFVAQQMFLYVTKFNGEEDEYIESIVKKYNDELRRYIESIQVVPLENVLEGEIVLMKQVAFSSQVPWEMRVRCIGHICPKFIDYNELAKEALRKLNIEVFVMVLETSAKVLEVLDEYDAEESAAIVAAAFAVPDTTHVHSYLCERFNFGDADDAYGLKIRKRVLEIDHEQPSTT